jgi:Na+/H+ antiporter NhaD/arsenite permease-like protein
MGLTSLPVQANPLWWSLALGACLGGNGTLVGASANVVVAGTARAHGQPIGFRAFLREGVPVTVITLAIASIYIWLRYLL